MRLKIFICLLLAAVTVAIYWPAGHFDIVYFDDTYFVTDNPAFNNGLTWPDILWSFYGVVVSNWHPVTSLSFVLTHQFFGEDPQAEHWVNIIFHAANAALLFLVLNRLTCSIWRSAIVAAIFAWHPLRVESVAWISERKDVLCGFFFLLALFCYAREARQIQSAGQSWPGTIFRPIARYRWTLICFALALMSKPMAVSLPLLLVLLDMWPLKRFSLDRIAPANSQTGNKRNVLAEPKVSDVNSTTRNAFSLVVEKWPFVFLAGLMSGLTYYLQKQTGAMVSWLHFDFSEKVANAILGYAGYLGKFFWPTNLAIIYPFHKIADMTEVWLAGLLLLAISALCVVQLRRRPYLLIGWLWYLISCIPIIGIVQVGIQAMADRYTYLPLIGPAISLVWLMAEWAKKLSAQKAFSTAAGVLLCVLAVAAHQQVELWHNTVSLFGHALNVTDDNYAAHFSLGTGYEREQGMTNAAMNEYRIAAKMNPYDRRPFLAVGGILRKRGRLADAIDVYGGFLRNNPDDVPVRVDLAGALLAMGKTAEADAELEQVLKIDPDNTTTLNDLAWTFATDPDPAVRDGPRAVQLARHACELTHYQQTTPIGTLAAAYAEAGRFDDAIAAAQKAISVAQQNNQRGLAAANEKLLEFYRAHKPYHQVGLVPATR